MTSGRGGCRSCCPRVLIVVGILIRLKVEESPEFEELKDEGEVSKNPLKEVLRDDWRNILRAFCLRIAETAGYAVSVTFMLSYISEEKLADRPVTLTATMIAAAIGIFATTFFGAWTDRIGRRPVYLLGTAIMIAWGIPLFLVVNTGSAAVIVLAFVISYAVCQNSLAGVQGAWFSELFNAKTRTTGASLAYQISAVVSGFTPLVATALYIGTGWIGPAVLFSFYGLLGLVAALVTRETWGRAEREEVEALERALKADGVEPAPPHAPSRPAGADHDRRPTDPTTTRSTDDLTEHADTAGTADPTERIERLRPAAYRIRLNALNMGEVQGQGYIGQALGVADVLAVAYTDQLRYRPDDPHWPDRDRFLLSIGHYAIALYAALAEAGIIPVEELETYGSDDSRLPMSGMASYTPGMEISGGSLGHGLAVATGMALGLRHLGNPARVFNLLSDGELDEGSTWEAAMQIAHHGLDNVTAIVDVNALQADGPTAGVLRTEPVTDKWQAFGWHALRGGRQRHRRARRRLRRGPSTRGSPSVLICDTRIGCGVPLLETREKAHFMRVGAEEWQIARDQLADGFNAQAPRRHQHRGIRPMTTTSAARRRSG